jgi:RNA polymerase sigma factor (sigma-70 family)
MNKGCLTMNDPDVALMLRFQRGDESAFGQLYERYKKRIVIYCYRFTGDMEIAEELAQEVLIRVYRASAGYRPEARFSTWVFRIATNVCLKETRKKEYRMPLLSLDAPLGAGEEGQPMDPPDTRSQGPDCALESREGMRRIHRAVRALPPNQRAALLLCTFGEFSYSRIAQQIGKTVSGVKSLIHRARCQLAAELEKDETVNGSGASGSGQRR